MDRVPNLKRYIPADATPQELLELERKIVVLTDKKAEIFSGALDIEAIDSMEDILRVLRRLDNYKLYQDISSPVELGRMLVDTGEVDIPESALPYVDFTRVAAEFEAEHSGVYTKSGYVFKADDGEPEQRPYVIKVELSSPRLESCDATYSLFLPAPSIELDDAIAALAVGGFEECRVTGVETSVEAISRIGVQSDEIVRLDDLANELSCILGDKRYKTFRAAVEVEQPDSIAGLLDIVLDLGNYSLMPPAVDNPDEYGSYLLYDTEEIDYYDFKDEVRDFIDYEEYGKYRMEADGIRETEQGWLRRWNEPFPRAEETQGQGMNMNL